ncbi:hypothetical protein D3C81_1072120 [compost metagenome]
MRTLADGAHRHPGGRDRGSGNELRTHHRILGAGRFRQQRRLVRQGGRIGNQCSGTAQVKPHRRLSGGGNTPAVEDHARAIVGCGTGAGEAMGRERHVIRFQRGFGEGDQGMGAHPRSGHRAASDRYSRRIVIGQGRAHGPDAIGFFSGGLDGQIACSENPACRSDGPAYREQPIGLGVLSGYGTAVEGDRAVVSGHYR